MKYITSFFKSKLGKGIFYVAGGTLFAQIINLLLTPLLTRIYTPEDFGLQTVYVTVVGILSFGAFKYEMGIPISKDNKIAMNVLALCLLVLFTFSALLFILLFFCGNFILEFVGFDSLKAQWYLIPLGVLLTGLYKVFYLWASRIKDYKLISRTTIKQSINSNIVKLAMGFTNTGSLGLILGSIVGQSSGFLFLSRSIMKNKELLKFIQPKEILSCLKHFKNFPLYNFPTHIISILGEKAPIIFFTVYFGNHIVGYYGLAYTIVRLPMSLIGQAVGDVFFSEAASIGRNNPKRLKELSNNLLKRLMIVGIIPLLVLLIAAPQLFSLVFGKEWYQAGEYARIISVMLFFILIFAPISRVYEVFEKQKQRLIIDIIRVFFVLLSFSVSWLCKLDSYSTVLLYSIVISFVHFLIYIFAQRILDNEIKLWSGS